MLKIYENIKLLRLNHGMTQQELAEAIGYSGGKSMISKIESGKIDLSQSKIKQFADLFGVTPGDLLGWDDEKINAIVKKQAELAAYEDKLEEEIRTRLIEMSTEQLEHVNDILGLELTEEELADLVDYAKFLISKRR